jgi:hypothetical protein
VSASERLDQEVDDPRLVELRECIDDRQLGDVTPIPALDGAECGAQCRNDLAGVDVLSHPSVDEPAERVRGGFADTHRPVAERGCHPTDLVSTAAVAEDESRLRTGVGVWCVERRDDGRSHDRSKAEQRPRDLGPHEAVGVTE